MPSKSLFVLALASAALCVHASKLTFAGVNIAGGDFGTDTSGTNYNWNSAAIPLKELDFADGAGQMEHFVQDHAFSLFRLPVSWQFLTSGQATGTPDARQFSKYNSLVQACLRTGAHCLIDIHNYARFNGQVVGQGGPSNEVFAELWSNIAKHWKDQNRVIFGIMNEPHDLPSLQMWAETVQAAVTAIRKTGASSQIILLPGDNWTSAATFVSGGSAEALNKVTNPDGSHTNLVMDVHKYLDSDGSGTSPDCVTDNVESSWTPLATWLRQNKRQALHTETGGGNNQQCAQYLLQQIKYQAENADVFLGYCGWAAGSFDPNGYPLSEVPTKNGDAWTDALTVSEALSPRKNLLVASVQ